MAGVGASRGVVQDVVACGLLGMGTDILGTRGDSQRRVS